VGEDAGALCKEVAVSLVGGGGVGAVDDGKAASHRCAQLGGVIQLPHQ
jgi:hypothetical protein